MFFVLALAGCGYSHVPLFPKEYRTVAVPILENRTAYRDVEFDLTEALIKEIELRTPYKVVKSGEADTIFTGTITAIEQRMLSRRSTGGLPQEMEVAVVVNYEWKNARTSESLRNRKGFAGVGRTVTAQPVGEPFEIAQHQAVQQLARDMVSSLQAGW